MASASAPVNELAKQLPASASSLAVPPPAASTQLKRWICQQRPRSGACCCCCCAAAASTRAGSLPGKKTERRGYMHQLFILLSYPPFSLLALAFLLSGQVSQVIRVYVLVHGLRLLRGVLLFYSILRMSVWPLALFCQIGWMGT